MLEILTCLPVMKIGIIARVSFEDIQHARENITNPLPENISKLRIQLVK
jgi:hypothetical protein